MAVALLTLALLLAGCTGDGLASSPSSRPAAIESTTLAPTSPASASPSLSPSDPSAPRPPIVSKPIPFPESRKQEMRAYAQRHYGLDTFSLIDPQVIVEHFTVSTTFEPVFNTFAVDLPHLGELPGTCAHFVIDTDGTIYQLVPLDLMCRHTVGLNYSSIGIEMVGESDADILGNPTQLDAALDLTLWLMQRFHIQLRNVIGHNESLTSPYHRERYRAWRCQTHGDWRRAEMRIYRAALARLARRHQVPLGPAARPVKPRCP
jgi:N-acetylmuramoyl-L-alanine amidase